MPTDSTRWRVSYSYLRTRVPEYFTGTIGEVYQEVQDLAKQHRLSRLRDRPLEFEAFTDEIHVFFRNDQSKRVRFLNLQAD